MSISQLLEATAKANYHLTMGLLNSGENPNVRDHSGDTPLHLTLRANIRDVSIIAELIRRGADVNLKNHTLQETPIFIAVANEEYNIVEMLLDAGARVNVKNLYSNTPLHLANSEIAELLLERGANIKAKNAINETPLMIALRVKNAKLIDILSAWSSSVNDEVCMENLMTNQQCCQNCTNGDSYEVQQRLCHLLKLIALKVAKKGDFTSSQFVCPFMTPFYNACLQEFKVMRDIKCDGHTLFDVFSKTDLSFVNNHALEQQIKQTKEMFTKCHALLHATFVKAKLRNEMTNEISNYNMTPELPPEIKKKILSYLTNDDLEKIINAVKYKEG